MILETIKETGASAWLVCSLEFDKVLEVTNTCSTKKDAVESAACHAIEERKAYNLRLLG